MTTIKFLGLLRNVDDSILKVELNKGFRFISIGEHEGHELLSNLERSPHLQHLAPTTTDTLNFETKKFYLIENTIETEKNLKGLPPELLAFQKEELEYLIPTFDLMRLFNGGNIRIHRQYYVEKDHPPFMSVGTTLHQQRYPKFHLEDKEISKLYSFLKETKLPPFDLDYIQLAFDNFNWSFETHNNRLSLLAIMSGLEALFNPTDRIELSFRICRNCAIILGKGNKEEANRIYKQAREIYNIRSRLIHGEKIDVSNEQIIEGRKLLGDSIKKLFKINKTKDVLLKELDESGFENKII